MVHDVNWIFERKGRPNKFASENNVSASSECDNSTRSIYYETRDGRIVLMIAYSYH
jgi:hypothetical protein